MAARRLCQLLRIGIQLATGLSREHTELAHARQVAEVPPVAHGDEATDADDLGLSSIPVGVDDLGRKSHDLAALGHLALDLEPELLELVDRGQLLRLAELREELVAPEELGTQERVVHDRRAVTGDLPYDPEELAQISDPLVHAVRELGELHLARVERRRQPLAAYLGLVALLFRLGEHAGLKVAVGEKLLLAFGVLLLLLRPGIARLLEQVVE